MATEKNPSIYYDRGTIGSSDELDEYGVWVKSEPQDLSSVNKESTDIPDPSIMNISDLPNIDENPEISLSDDGIDLPDISNEDFLDDLNIDLDLDSDAGDIDIPLTEDSVAADAADEDVQFSDGAETDDMELSLPEIDETEISAGDDGLSDDLNIGIDLDLDSDAGDIDIPLTEDSVAADASDEDVQFPDGAETDDMELSLPEIDETEIPSGDDGLSDDLNIGIDLDLDSDAGDIDIPLTEDSVAANAAAEDVQFSDGAETDDMELSLPEIDETEISAGDDGLSDDLNIGIDLDLDSDVGDIDIPLTEDSVAADASDEDVQFPDGAETDDMELSLPEIDETEISTDDDFGLDIDFDDSEIELEPDAAANPVLDEAEISIEISEGIGLPETADDEDFSEVSLDDFLADSPKEEDDVILSELSEEPFAGEELEDITFDDTDNNPEELKDIPDINSIISLDGDDSPGKDEPITIDDIDEANRSSINFDDVAAFSDDLQQNDDSPKSDDADMFLDEDETITIDDIDEANRSSINFDVSDIADNSSQQHTAEQVKEEISADLLLKIANELSSIREELSSLKNELSSMKTETPKETAESEIPPESPAGFFDKEDDDKISLTGDELDNILHTADFTEEAGEDANNAVETEDDGFAETESPPEAFNEQTSEESIEEPDLSGGDEDAAVSEEDESVSDEDNTELDISELSLDLDELPSDHKEPIIEDLLIEESDILGGDEDAAVSEEDETVSNENNTELDISELSLDLDELPSDHKEPIIEDLVIEESDILDEDEDEDAAVSEEDKSIDPEPEPESFSDDDGVISAEIDFSFFDKVPAPAETDDEINGGIIEDAGIIEDTLEGENPEESEEKPEEESAEIAEEELSTDSSLDELDLTVEEDEPEIIEIDEIEIDEPSPEDISFDDDDDFNDIEIDEAPSVSFDEHEIPLDEAIAEKDTEELKQLREEGARPVTPAPEDTSYLEEDDAENIDLSDAVIEEPDFSGIVENPVTEPSLEDISIELDLEEEPLLTEETEVLEMEDEDELELSIPELDDADTDSSDMGSEIPEEENFAQVIPEGFVVESEDSDLSLIDPEIDFEEIETINPEDEHVLDAVPIEDDSFILDDDLIVEEMAPASQMDEVHTVSSNEADSGNIDIPQNLKQELKTVLSYMDKLLESLPEDKIEEFARSEYFDTYKKLFEELGLV